MTIRGPKRTIRLSQKYAQPRRAPPIRLTPYAWSKLLYLRDAGSTEVGGFGISAAGDLLLVEDICLVKQTCGVASVKFDDAAVADYFDQQVDRGLAPERFARNWVHTHPGTSPAPSATDEATFSRCFGSADWAVMFILARGGKTYARLQFSAGPRGSQVLPVEIDFREPFLGSAEAVWEEEYCKSVIVEPDWPPIPVRAVSADEQLVSRRDRRLFADDPLFQRPSLDLWETIDDRFF